MNQLQKLKIIVSQEQSYYDKNNDHEYYKAYEFVLKEIDKLQKEEEWRKINGLMEYINLKTKRKQLSFLKMVGLVKVG